VTVLPDGKFIVIVNDKSGPATDAVNIGLYGHIFDPRNFTGTDGPDVINGASLRDTINGGAGNDVLYGDAGDDIIYGGAGADYIDGGAGYDLVSFGNATAGVDARLYTGGGTVGDAAYDRYVNIEALQGSAFNDVLIGDTSANVIYGYEGDDYIDGLGGGDTLRGDGGQDAFMMREGAEAVDGGSGWDTVRYDNATSAVDARLYDPSQNSGWAAGDTYRDVEVLVGSAFNDILLGDTSINAVYGGDGGDYIDGVGGGDYLYGNDGQDWFLLRPGADIVDGGAGVDTANFLYSTAAISVDLLGANGVTGFVSDGSGAVDTLISIEDVDGSSFDDVIYANNLANKIASGAGNDQVVAWAGDDLVVGGAGNDGLIGHLGNDTLYGDDESIDGGTHAAMNDLLYGGGGNDALHGGRGNDVLIGDLVGEFGADLLFGGQDNDTLIGGAANDYLDGGFGNDWLYSTGQGDVVVGGFGADTIWLFDYAGGLTTISDFAAAQGDRLVLYDLVADYGLGANTAAAFTSGRLTLVQSGADMLLQMDQDGSSATAPITVAQLNGTTFAQFALGLTLI
jgi:Ca2+-binding RTX toxin-like protein